MNWKKIESDYPRANKLAEENFISDGYRWLYDFFDVQGIIVTVEHDSEYFFDWGIYVESSIDLCDRSENHFASRQLAEIAGFTKAFQIIEEQLTDSKESR